MVLFVVYQIFKFFYEAKVVDEKDYLILIEDLQKDSLRTIIYIIMKTWKYTSKVLLVRDILIDLRSFTSWFYYCYCWKPFRFSLIYSSYLPILRETSMLGKGVKRWGVQRLEKCTSHQKLLSDWKGLQFEELGRSEPSSVCIG